MRRAPGVGRCGRCGALAIRCWLLIGIGGIALSVALPSQAQITASGDTYSTEPATALNVDGDDGVLANDSGGDEGDYTAVLVGAPTNGALVLNGDGGFLYLPNLGFTGSDSFTYRVNDGERTSNVATVTISVASTSSNSRPVAVADAYSGAERTQLDVNAADGVLANDTDEEPGPLTAVLEDDVNHGSLTLNADGSFRYTPEDDFTGDDEFRYRARDSGGAMSAEVRFRINVDSVNEAPVATADSYRTNEGQTLSVGAGDGVLDNDTDPDRDRLDGFLGGRPSSGTLTLRPDGGFGFAPAAGFAGTVTFTYEAGDGTLRSNTATVTITVSAVNGRPAAQPDSYSTNEGQTLNVGAGDGVLANDTDPDGDTLTRFRTSGPSNGTLTLQPNGAFSFAPATGFAGTATFTYEASDGTLRSSRVTVTITVECRQLSAGGARGFLHDGRGHPVERPAAAACLATTADPDGGTTLTAALVRTVTNGSLTLRPDGSFTYTPAANFSGATTFTYQARDGSVASATVTVTITVTAANDAPFVSNAPSTTVSEGVTYRYTLTASDPDGNTLDDHGAYVAELAPLQCAGNGDRHTAQSDVGTHDVVLHVSDGIAPPWSCDSKSRCRPSTTRRRSRRFPPDGVRRGRFRARSRAVRDGFRHASRRAQVCRGRRFAPRCDSERRRSAERHPDARRERGPAHDPFHRRGRDEPRASAGRADGDRGGPRRSRRDLECCADAGRSRDARDVDRRIANRAATVGTPGVTVEASFTGDVPFRFDASRRRAAPRRLRGIRTACVALSGGSPAERARRLC